MLKIAICDDEKAFLDIVNKTIDEEFYNKDIEYKVTLYSRGEDLLLCKTRHEYDIIFLDIELLSISGVDIAQNLRENGYKGVIVFITSYMDYSRLGYKVEAFRYILKANLVAELRECITALKSKFGLRKYCINSNVFSLNEIIYIESSNHKAIFHLVNNNIYEVYQKLDNIEESISSSDFLRVHKSYLINISYVERVERYSVTLTNNTNIPIPKKKYKDVKNKIDIWRLLCK